MISCLVCIDSPLSMRLMILFRGHLFVRYRQRFASKIRESRRPVDIVADVLYGLTIERVAAAQRDEVGLANGCA